MLVGELFTAQGLSNTAWAFAAAGRPSPALFARLAAEATPRLSEFKPQELASLAWAFATVGQPAPALFDGLAVVAAQRLTFFKPLEVPFPPDLPHISPISPPYLSSISPPI